VRAVIAEDDVLLRAGLVRLLSDAEVDVIADVGDAEALLAAVDDDLPDVVITDIRMPPTFRDEGTRAAVALRERYPRLGILVLSQHVEARYAERLLRSHARGIGYLLKARVASTEEFLESVRRVAAGGSVVDSDVVSSLLSRSVAERTLSLLSPRELDVLALVAAGRSNLAIAAELHLTTRTVESHVAGVFGKLGLPEDAGDNRRVLAVLAHLRAGQPAT
jgi:DNA-binding NarL/FixJ family response regulator